MNFALTTEQEFLREAAAGALARHPNLAAARLALDGAPRADLWPTAIEAGWTGLLVSEGHGGADLGAFEAMLVMQECGRVLASLPILGHLLATAVLEADSDPQVGLLRTLATGDKRAALVPAQPPTHPRGSWTVDGSPRGLAPVLRRSSCHHELHGEVRFVPDVPGADLLVVLAVEEDGTPCAVLVDGAAALVTPVTRFDGSRWLGHVGFNEARAVVLDVPDGALESCWHLGQALLAAESLGTVEAALTSSVAYAKDRYAFGRPIGSFQAIKHKLVEVLRRQENARSLCYYAGWASGGRPEEFALAAAAARLSAGDALDFASRAMISVHGGLGATWEHDAHLYFRRAELNRHLLGGVDAQAERVATELLRESRSPVQTGDAVQR